MKIHNISLLIFLVFSSSNAIASALQKPNSVNKMPALANSSSRLALAKSVDKESFANASNAKAEQDKKKKKVEADLKQSANDTLPLLVGKSGLPCAIPKLYDEKMKLDTANIKTRVQSLPIIGNSQAALPKVMPSACNHKSDQEVLPMRLRYAMTQKAEYFLEKRSPDNLYVILRQRDCHELYIYDGVDMSKKRTRQKIASYRAYTSIFTPDSKWLITQTDERPGEISLYALHQDKIRFIRDFEGYYSFEVSPNSTHVAVLGKTYVGVVRLDAQNKKIAFSRTYPFDAYELRFENDNLLVTTADEKQYVIDCATV